MSEREKYYLEAAEVAVACGRAARNGAFGDEWTSRDIRDAMESVGSVLSQMANNPQLTVTEALEEE